MILEVLPNTLFSLSTITVLLRNKETAILHKVLYTNLINKEMYISSIAILYILNGKQIISNYDGDKVTLQKGQMIYLSKDMYLVSDFVTDNDQFEAFIFFMDDTFIEKNTQPGRRNENVEISNNKIRTMQANEQIEKYVHSLISVYLNTDNSNKILDLKLMELLSLIELQDEGLDFLSLFYRYSSPGKKRDIVEFMKINYLKNLKIEDYALLTGRSISTFIREFKKIYKTTPNQWLIEQRLEKAHDLLMNTDMNVTETAFEVGYENVSHFIKAYKTKYGHTPKLSKIR
jgi:AraC-like DNA-binding protein